jgi:hypothetical protein
MHPPYFKYLSIFPIYTLLVNPERTIGNNIQGVFFSWKFIEKLTIQRIPEM